MSERFSLTVFELDVSFCALRYGETTADGTCPAVLGVDSDDKCYNSLATCPVLLSYLDDTVTLRFAQSVTYLPHSLDAIPSLLSAEISPGTIKPGENLGERSTLTVTLRDHLHPDTSGRYDKYLADRAYDPASQGTYWGKLRARQPYLRGRACRLLIGYVEDGAFVEEERRHFFVESFTGPTIGGLFQIEAKDIFKQLEGDRAVAPAISEGYLVADISAAATSLTLSPTDIGQDYPHLGYLNIGGAEIVYFEHDPTAGNDANCILLIHCDGADGSTAFTDSSSAARAITRNGNTQVDTAWKKFGTGSALFDGAGDYLSLADNAAWTFAGDFTLEAVIKPASIASIGTLHCHSSGTAANMYRLYVTTLGQLSFQIVSGGVVTFNTATAATTLEDLEEHHVAVTRSGTTWRLFIDGVMGQEVTDAAAIPNFTGTLKFGINGDAATDAFNGWADEIRVSDVARWTDDFDVELETGRYASSADDLFITRAQLNTEAVAHSAQDRAQLVLDIFGVDVAEIIYLLMVTYGGVPASYISLSTWLTETEGFLGTVYTAYIAEPTPVRQLIDELIEQAALCVWFDDLTPQIRLTVLRSISTDAALFDEERRLGDAPLGIREQPDKRLSQVLTYYAQKNPLKALDDLDNYQSSQWTVDGETETLNGSSALKVITSRWIPALARSVAQKLNNKLLARYRTAPRLFSFATQRYADSDVELGRGYNVGSFLLQDAAGARVDVPIQVTRLVAKADRFLVEAEEMRFDQLDDDVDPVGHLVIIDADSYNINLRTLHDSQYTEAVAGDTVTVEINSGVTVGSTSTASYALDVGSWPSDSTTGNRTSGSAILTGLADTSDYAAGMFVTGTGIPDHAKILSVDSPTQITLDANATSGAGTATALTIYLIIIDVTHAGRIAGKGGAGGEGGYAVAASAGAAGGVALYTRYPINLDVSAGEIWGGAGGGGGGDSNLFTPGGGGGGGGGTDPGAGALGGGGATGVYEGADGTETAGGAGGTGVPAAGGAGGAPGSAGSSGGTASMGSPGAGGAAGAAIDGDSLVNVTSGPGDIRGSQIN